MKRSLYLWLLLVTTGPLRAGEGDFVRLFETPYNDLSVTRRGSLVEMDGRSRRGNFVEAITDVNAPLQPVLPYSRTLFAGLFIQDAPSRVLVLGFGGGAFQRLFSASFPQAFVQTVELDQKIVEIGKEYLGFNPTPRNAVTVMDCRVFIRENKEQWDWIILDEARGGYVPKHLKTEEFYNECAERLTDNGLFLCNLNQASQLYYTDMNTISKVFPQFVLFHAADSDNVILCAAKYRKPAISDPAAWRPADKLTAELGGHVDMKAIRKEQESAPSAQLTLEPVLKDDFAPGGFLDAVKLHDTEAR